LSDFPSGSVGSFAAVEGGSTIWRAHRVGAIGGATRSATSENLMWRWFLLAALYE